MSTPIYSIRNLEHSYGERTVLSIDHLDIEPSAIVGLTGPNGSGKSTLLHVLAFLLAPTSGQIRFNGQPVNSRTAPFRKHVSLLLQEPFLLKRSVRANVSYGLKVRGLGSDSGRVNEALEMVGLDPASFAHRSRHELSGGEAQRVALAARLALRPKVLLLDEPTSSVDKESSQLIREAALMARAEWDTTLLIVSHGMDWLMDLCDTILRLRRGRLAG